MSSSSPPRALHWVLKIGDRSASTKFFRDQLCMTVLRHEEFSSGCEAACNGPYDGKWSKTMIGYGGEDKHFVLELTYNYGVGKYKLGDDLKDIVIAGSDGSSSGKSLTSPDGYKFTCSEEEEGKDVRSVTLGCKDLGRSLAYWRDLLGMEVVAKEDKEAVLRFGEGQASLKFVELGKEVDRGSAYGRIAFSVPANQLPGIEAKVKSAGNTILTPYVKLDTPGKASVHVVILADPDGHEICFVGDEAFRELSQTDPAANAALNAAMEADKSNEWFAKKGKAKEEAA